MSSQQSSALPPNVVLSAYRLRAELMQSAPRSVVGGFSGAQLWRLETSLGALCVRRWPPEHPTAARLTLIHHALRHAAAHGIGFLPVPLATRDGRTFCEADETLWEIAPWLAGEGNFSRDPRPEKLRPALVALARFHLATADFPSPQCCVAPSPGISAPLDQLRRWTPSELAQLRAAMDIHVGRIGNPTYDAIITNFALLAPQIERELASAETIATRLQPAIRDVWADHFLFTGDTVTGLVDFGGLNIDTPATDVARLLGSLAGDDAATWSMGLAAYETVRPLSSAERQLLPIFDRSTVALSGMNWLRWIFLEQRTFNDMCTVDARLQTIAARLRAAIAQMQ